MDLDRRGLSLPASTHRHVRPNHHVYNPDERTSAQADPVVAAVPVAEGPADAAEAVSSGALAFVTWGSSMRSSPLPGGSSGAQRPDRDDGDAVGSHAAVPGTGDDCQGCRWPHWTVSMPAANLRSDAAPASTEAGLSLTSKAAH